MELIPRVVPLRVNCADFSWRSVLYEGDIFSKFVDSCSLQYLPVHAEEHQVVRVVVFVQVFYQI